MSSLAERLHYHTYKTANLLLGAAEKIVLAAQSSQPVKTVWIIGPPRSGTTLLYQMLINSFEFAYFTNFTSKFYTAPIIAFWLQTQRLQNGSASVGYSSRYGRTDEPLGPHEAGKFWYRWFPNGDQVFVPSGYLQGAAQRSFRNEIAGIGHVTGRPVLFKNVFNSVRIAPIIETFPDAGFLICHRNPLDTAQSILRGRTKLHQDKGHWIGVRPAEYEKLRHAPYDEQIAGQIYYTYKQIETDRRKWPKNFFDVHYKEMCDNPQGTAIKIGEFLKTQGNKLRTNGAVPERFPFSSGQSLNDQDYRLLKRATDRYW